MSSIVPGRMNGVDVSSVQGIIDWKAVKAAGFDFAYVQASRYSSTRELTFMRNVDGARDAGLAVGAYHFCSHGTDPVAQAEFFFGACGGLGNKSGELPPMVDWEHCTPASYTDHPAHCVTWLESMVRRVTELWYPDNARMRIPRRPVVYTYPVYAKGHQPALGWSTELLVYPLAYASYKAGPDGKLVPWLPGPEDGPIHALPAPWKHWTLWQYSGDRGELVPGVSGYCDRQLFNGSQGDWADFLGLARPAAELDKAVIEDVVERKQ